MAKGDYTRLKKACKELSIKTVGEKTEDITEEFLSACDERLKGIPVGQEKNHFSKETMELYNEMTKRGKSTEKTKAGGEEKVLQIKKVKKTRFSRIDAVTKSFKENTNLRALPEIAGDADSIYVIEGGVSNTKESKYYVNIILRVLDRMGHLNEVDGKFSYKA